MTKNTMVEATFSDIPIRGACRVIPVGAGGPEKRDFWLKNAMTTSRPGALHEATGGASDRGTAGPENWLERLAQT